MRVLCPTGHLYPRCPNCGDTVNRRCIHQHRGLDLGYTGSEICAERAKATPHSNYAGKCPYSGSFWYCPAPKRPTEPPPLDLTLRSKGQGASLTSEPQPTSAAENHHPEGRGTGNQGHVGCWQTPSCRDTLIRGCCHPGKRGNVFKACTGAKCIFVYLPGS